TYQKTLQLSQSDIDGKVIRIRFEGIAHFAQVYCNGLIMGEHKGGYTAFEVDLTSAVVVGDNLLTIKVDALEKDIPPFGGAIDYLCYGGIYREASLIISDRIYIDKVFINCSDNISKREMKVKVRPSKAVTINCGFKVFDKDSGEKIDEFYASGFGEFEVTRIVKDAKLWDIENPKLYKLEVTANGDGYSDTMTEIFGFRKAEFTTSGFMLNGKKIKLVGLNRHQSYAYIGYAAPKLLQYGDADLIKQLGCNVVRTSHYPQSKHFLNRCDEIGLLVVTEIEGWNYVGFGAWQDVLLCNITEMIEEQFNHPSIALWGVRVNESEDNNSLYERTNAKAHEIDRTRQTGGVRCIKGSNLLEDVYTFNDFLHDGKNDGLCKQKDVTLLKNPVPYLITEHNGHMFPTKEEDNTDRVTQQALRHLKVLDAAYADKTVCGAIGWCMSDYNTHKEFGSGDGVCYHGVTNMFRNYKEAAYAYKSQQDRELILEICSGINYGDFDKDMPKPMVILSNCDEIRVYNQNKIVTTLLPSKKYLHLPHPPFFVENLIAADTAKLLGVAEVDGEKVSKIMLSYMRNTLTAVEKFEIARLLKYNKTLSEWSDLAAKLVYRWGYNDNYKFVGVKKGKEVISKTIEEVSKISMRISSRYNEIKLADTYEIIQIDISVLSQNNTLLRYYKGAVKATVSGGEIIGNDNMPITNGNASFYVKVTNAGQIVCDVQGDCRLGSAQIIIPIL
ncbi:MAG: glycoside hydrolase family 2 TIM barrel-domain containing protein, partial [Clostridia bacterium]